MGVHFVGWAGQKGRKQLEWRHEAPFAGEKALKKGMEAKSKEFKRRGAEIYQKA